MALSLTVLGCDGSHPGPGGAGSGYLVRDWASATSLWMDTGPGTFATLQRFTDPLALSAVVITHQHEDHCSDIVSYLTAIKWTLPFDRAPVPVFSAPGIRERITQELDGYLDWHEVGDGDGADVGGLRLRFSRTDHPPVTLAVRVEGAARTLGYSADTGPRWPMAALGSDLDLALCEATYTEREEQSETGAIHMTAAQAGRSARQADARRLVVTHRWSTVPAAAVLEEATASFGGRVDQAEVGRGFSL